jgi:hypothetical protein
VLRLRERDIAWCWALFLTRVSGFGFGPEFGLEGLEGARALSEPLGKLTALQQLRLDGRIFVFLLFCDGDVCCG